MRTLWKRALKEKIALDSVKSVALLHQQAITKHERKSALASDHILPDAIKIPPILRTHNALFPATCFIWISCQWAERGGVHFTALPFPRSQPLWCKICEFCVFLEVETSKETQDKQQPWVGWAFCWGRRAGGPLCWRAQDCEPACPPLRKKWWHVTRNMYVKILKALLLSVQGNKT